MNANAQLNNENPADGRSASNGELGNCWPWSHKWKKWKDISNEKNSMGHPVVVQERRCITCGKAQRFLVICDS